MKKPEILAPAGSLEVLKTALHYGADAVYIGGEQFGLRAKAKNFSEDDMRQGIEYAHKMGKKIYVTANITAHDRDLSGVRDYFSWLAGVRPDALIISDPGVFSLAREICPDIDIHISTQANNVNSLTCRFWQEQGAKRVVTARELSLQEISTICKETPGLEIETFVHGAMCISHSGRCLLSHYFTGRDANLGACTHPCRWRYHIVEETRPGEYLPIEENERGTYIFNSRDLCMIEHVPEMVEAGIDSFKIEGRMKTALYVASVVRAYRQAVDMLCDGTAESQNDSGDLQRDDISDSLIVNRNLEAYRDRLPWLRDEVKMCTYRQFTTGFFFGSTDRDSQIYDSNTYEKGAVYLGCIDSIGGSGAALGRTGDDGSANRGSGRPDEAGDVLWFYQKNKFSVGDEIELMLMSGENITARVGEMFDDGGISINDCPHPGQRVGVRLSFDGDGSGVVPGVLMRRRV